MTAVVVTIILALLITIGLGAWYARSRMSALQQQLTNLENTAAHDQRSLTEQFTRTAQQNHQTQEAQHRQALAARDRAYEDQRKQFEKQLRDARKETTTLLDRHRLSVDAGDWNSANDIRMAASGAGLSLVVLTNVVLPSRSDTGEVYWAQLDHLVITKHQLLIIESKRWSGLVLDSVDPRSVLGELSHLLANAELGSCQNTALHITSSHDNKNKSDLVVNIRRHGEGADRKTPTKQVRRHALALGHFLKEHGEHNTQWIHTAVYYSYPGSKVHHQPYNGHTKVVSTMKELGNLLRKASTPSDDIIDVERITATLSDHGANVAGTGDYKALTTCPVTLQRPTSSPRSQT